MDKATHEQVMDQRTRIKLQKLLNTDVLGEVNGIISTGKEANVYHAISGQNPETGETVEQLEYAIKIYKTTLNEFKNRTEYINGDYRFKHQNKSNPRKLIKLWAEKEMRNLKRLQAKNIPSPIPITLRENILVMSFIGVNGVPAPCLKDAPLSGKSSAGEFYLLTSFFCRTEVERLLPSVREDNERHVPQVPLGPRRSQRIQHPVQQGQSLDNRCFSISGI